MLMDPNDNELDVIVDNVVRTVAGFLHENVQPGSALSIATAYFDVQGYWALHPVLKRAKAVRLLLGQPRKHSKPEPSRLFRLTPGGKIEAAEEFKQRRFAYECAQWIRERVDVRTIRPQLMHAKFYYVSNDDDTATLFGSSNFTKSGLESEGKANIELNFEIRQNAQQRMLLRWFDRQWRDRRTTKKIKEDFLAILRRMSLRYSPRYLYHKTLRHVLVDAFPRERDRRAVLKGASVLDTHFWKQLRPRQKSAAAAAIYRLLRYGRCMLAESTEIDRMLTTLAVIRFFKKPRHGVLVLCPEESETNWTQHTASAHREQDVDAAADESVDYTVLTYPDLVRRSGRKGDIDFSDFDWGAYELVVLAESDRFVDERGSYSHFLSQVVRETTKVMLLSTDSAVDDWQVLRKQMYLMLTGPGNQICAALGMKDRGRRHHVARAMLDDADRNVGGQGQTAGAIQFDADCLAVMSALVIARPSTEPRLRILGEEDAPDERSYVENLTLDDHFVSLLDYTSGGEEEVRKEPLGIYALTAGRAGRERAMDVEGQSGVLLCLKYKGRRGRRRPDRLWPYFMVYVGRDGVIRHGARDVTKCLQLCRTLAMDGDDVEDELEQAFEVGTRHGDDLSNYEQAVRAAICEIADALEDPFRERRVGDGGKSMETWREEVARELELISWFIISDGKVGADGRRGHDTGRGENRSVYGPRIVGEGETPRRSGAGGGVT